MSKNAKAIVCEESNIEDIELTSNEEKMNALISRGISLTEVHFHSAVNNGDDVPENSFNHKSAAKSRRAKMWWIPGDGVLCLHNGKYIPVPAANVRFSKVE